MTFDPTKPARTKSGLKVEILPRRLKGAQPLLVITEHDDGSESVGPYDTEDEARASGYPVYELHWEE